MNMNKLNRKIIFPASTAILLVLLLMFTSTVSGDCIPISGESMEDNTNRKPFVCFDHDVHNETAQLEDKCNLCHHVYEDGALVQDESSEDSSCAECHGTEDATIQFDLISKFHQRCRGCHLKEEKGPVTCGECHSKR